MLVLRSSKMLRRVFLSSVMALGLVGTLGLANTSANASTPEVETYKDIIVKLAPLDTTLTGTYLSARLAQDQQNLALAAFFYTQALEKNPDDPLLLERNFVLTLAVGEHDSAFKLADRMAEQAAAELAAKAEAEKTADGAAAEAKKNGNGNGSDKSNSRNGRVTPMVHMALGVKALKGKSYARAVKNFDAGLKEMKDHPVDILGPAPLRRNVNSPRLLSASAQFGPFATISQTILRAWSLIGQDRKNLDDVLKSLDVTEEGNGVNQFFFRIHSGLIAAYAKDYARSATFLRKSLQADPNSIVIADALMFVLLRSDNTKEAKQVYSDFMNSAADLEDKAWFKKRFEKLEPVANPIRSPQAGAAELFATLGDALTQERALEGGALYLNFADYLRGEHDRTDYALGQLFERMKQDDQALKHFDHIKKDSAIYRKAQRQAAFVLARMERADEAAERLKGVLDGKTDDLSTISALARIYQSEEKFQDSIDILTRGINGLKEKRDIHWSLYFLRGSAYDQIKNWPKTEADMQAALKLFPNQPTVLNYLGYSWVDRGLNLEEAIEMIRQAVALRPFDGFFVDSLGWAHYRLNEFDDAVIFLERAVELRPEDPTITDHLGDAYWKAGRKNEAYFQWNRVKTMKPKDELLKKVLEKIEKGEGPSDLPKKD